MKAQLAFATLLALLALAGLAFVGLSLAHAMRQHDLMLWPLHPLFGSGVAALIGALTGSALMVRFCRSAGHRKNASLA